LIPVEDDFGCNRQAMTMTRRALVLLLSGLLVLSGAAAMSFAANAVCAPAAALAAGDEGACQGCGDTGDTGPTPCPAPACTGACAAGPMVSALRDSATTALPAANRSHRLPRGAVAANRPIRPDLPPPR
jgi:hypothetical protein